MRKLKHRDEVTWKRPHAARNLQVSALKFGLSDWNHCWSLQLRFASATLFIHLLMCSESMCCAHVYVKIIGKFETQRHENSVTVLLTYNVAHDLCVWIKLDYNTMHVLEVSRMWKNRERMKLAYLRQEKTSLRLSQILKDLKVLFVVRIRKKIPSRTNSICKESSKNLWGICNWMKLKHWLNTGMI